MLNLTAPVRVAVIDVAGPLADLDCGGPSSRPTRPRGSWCARAGRPLGSIEIPLRDPVIYGRRAGARGEPPTRRRMGQRARVGPPSRRRCRSPGRASSFPPTSRARLSCAAASRRLAELDHPDYEVIVVDNRPADAAARRSRGSAGGAGAAARDLGRAQPRGVRRDRRDHRLHRRRRSGSSRLAVGARPALRAPAALSAVTGLVVPLELETQAQIFFEQSGSGLDRGYAPLTFERAGRFLVRRRDEQAAQRAGPLAVPDRRVRPRRQHGVPHRRAAGLGRVRRGARPRDCRRAAARTSPCSWSCSTAGHQTRVRARRDHRASAPRDDGRP